MIDSKGVESVGGVVAMLDIDKSTGLTDYLSCQLHSRPLGRAQAQSGPMIATTKY